MSNKDGQILAIKKITKFVDDIGIVFRVTAKNHGPSDLQNYSEIIVALMIHEGPKNIRPKIPAASFQKFAGNHKLSSGLSRGYGRSRANGIQTHEIPHFRETIT